MSSADPPKHVWQPPTAEELQTLLPQYEVTLLLGRGGMGVVFKARQKSLNRLVAIKLLPPLEDQDELKLEERFHQEAQTLAHLNHPCIVQIYDFGETVSGQPFFVMEFVDGMDVADLIAAQGQLSVDETLRIIRPVCEALEYAHRRGVIHRDIKPSNVMVDHEGMVKVADFGLAKLQDPAVANNLTRTHVALGTQEFAAPEVFKPGMVVDQRADIYSLGVMLYQMLTGEIPRVMFKLPSLRRPELGTRFDAFVCKALETDPSDRFQTAAEFQQALDAVMVVRPELRQKRTKLRWAPALIALSLMGGMIMAKKATSHVHGGLPLAMPKTGGPAAISLWDTQQKVPKEAAVRWENGAIVLGDAKYKGMLVWSQPRSRDAIFRAELRTNPDAEYAQIRLRYNWTEGPGDFYRLQLHGGMVDLSVSEHGRGREIKAWPLPRAYGPDEWAQIELRAVGDALTVSLDGKELETIHDPTLAGPGGVMIVANKNGWFRHIEYVPLDAPAHGPAADKVINLLPLADVKRDAINSDWNVTAEGGVRSLRDKKAGRLEFPYAPPAEYDFEIDFTVEDGDSGYVMQVLPVPGHWLDWRLLPPPAFGPCLDGVEPGNGPRTEGIGQLFRLKAGDRHQSLVEVRTHSLRALVDGREIARYTGDFRRLSDPMGVFKLRDTTHVGVGVLDIGLMIHNATVREVSPGGKSSATVPSLADQPWQPLLNSPDAVARSRDSGIEMTNGWITLAKPVYLVRLAGGKNKTRDMAFRATIRPPANEWPLVAVLHAGADPQYNLDIHHDRLTLQRISQVASANPVYTKAAEVLVVPSASSAGLFALEVTLEADLITVVMDGQRVMEVRQPGIASRGDITLAAAEGGKGSGRIKDLMFKMIDDTRASSPAKAKD